jgi:hypothetical protein
VNVAFVADLPGSANQSLSRRRNGLRESADAKKQRFVAESLLRIDVETT